MPVAGTTIQHFGFSMKDASKVRLMYLFSAPLWVAYAAIRMSIGGILVDSINIVSIIVGIIRLDLKKKKPADNAIGTENNTDTVLDTVTKTAIKETEKETNVQG